MEIMWEYNLETELRRIIFTAERIKNHFYQRNGFLVLPRLVGHNPRVVYFPRLDFQNRSDFWTFIPRKDMQKELSDLNIKTPSKIRKAVEKSIKKDMLTKKEIFKIKKAWKKVVVRFIKILNILFDTKKIEIIIRVTKYGSLSSYFPTESKGKKKIYIYFRYDQDISHLAEAIITAFFVYELKYPRKSRDIWFQKEITSDFLFKYTKLNAIFPGYTPTMSITGSNGLHSKLHQESTQYLNILGFNSKAPIKLIKDKLIIKDKEVSDIDFSKSEIKILSCLVKNSGEIVKFEDIAKLIWKKDINKKFSLWAIAKKIQRIRSKIRDFGIHYNVIETHRKKGYMIKLQ